MRCNQRVSYVGLICNPNPSAFDGIGNLHPQWLETGASTEANAATSNVEIYSMHPTKCVRTSRRFWDFGVCKQRSFKACIYQDRSVGRCILLNRVNQAKRM